MNELFDLPVLEVKKEVNSTKLQPKLAALLKDLNKNLYNKENSIKLILLAVLAGESAFLLGEPGTAKSLIAHRISEGFEDLDTTKPENAGCVKYFEYLMSQFSTPDEIFGPVSLQALKNDEYKRITDNYLPKAQFAFLDEIWKASPAIQNSLLTILNEKKFQNGFESQKVPLQGFVAASNELPAKNEGLEAIFDRFLVRIIEDPISSDSTFFKMITSKKDTNTQIANKIDGSKLKLLQEKAEEVEFPENLFEIIRNIRLEIKNYNKSIKEDDEPFLVSDRRWKKIVGLLKMSAFLNDRKEINLKENTNNDAELGFYIFYYELLRRNSKVNTPYYIYLDRRNNRQKSRGETLKQLLQKDMHPVNKFGIRTTDKGRNIKVLEFVNSNAYNLIQFTDLIMGAIGYHYNKKHLLPDASQHKSAFAMYICNKINKSDLIFNTDKNGYKNLNLWLYQPCKKANKK